MPEKIVEIVVPAGVGKSFLCEKLNSNFTVVNNRSSFTLKVVLKSFIYAPFYCFIK